MWYLNIGHARKHTTHHYTLSPSFISGLLGQIFGDLDIEKTWKNNYSTHLYTMNHRHPSRNVYHISSGLRNLLKVGHSASQEPGFWPCWILRYYGPPGKMDKIRNCLPFYVIFLGFNRFHGLVTHWYSLQISGGTLVTEGPRSWQRKQALHASSPFGIRATRLLPNGTWQHDQHVAYSHAPDISWRI